MTAKKLDFLMTMDGQKLPVKARIFEGDNGDTYAHVDGAIFCGLDVNLLDLDQAIEILQAVRAAAGKSAYKESKG